MLRSRVFPMLLALVLTGTGSAMAETASVRIEEPRVDGVLLDWCRVYADRCGQPAADAFCRANGYRRSVRFVKWVNPLKPTKIISDGSICDAEGCDSFRWIECKPRN
jgi:hypothetical protein